MTRQILHALLDAHIDQRDVEFTHPATRRMRAGRLVCVGDRYCRVFDREGVLHNIPTGKIRVKDKGPRRCSCGNPLEKGEEDCLGCRTILEGFNELFEAARPPDPECAKVLEENLWDYAGADNENERE